ncbi:hypothetical protein ABLG96_10285 [Nakamurella sp. A5-74]|uniref:LPXTG cell wall anchor domain-containing protein n=1 Tax=Nakamurella sp. A5-74 TaxID=3158264 RepID=A0AAU8DV80_9ACTN
MSSTLAVVFMAETKGFSVTGLPAILIILAIIAIFVGIGVFIGRRAKRRKG